MIRLISRGRAGKSVSSGRRRWRCPPRWFGRSWRKGVRCAFCCPMPCWPISMRTGCTVRQPIHEVTMQNEELVKVAVAALEELKGQDITVIDVRGKTSVTDFMVIASGTSSRHVKSLANEVLEKVKEQ